MISRVTMQDYITSYSSGGKRISKVIKYFRIQDFRITRIARIFVLIKLQVVGVLAVIFYFFLQKIPS